MGHFYSCQVVINLAQVGGNEERRVVESRKRKQLWRDLCVVFCSAGKRYKACVFSHLSCSPAGPGGVGGDGCDGGGEKKLVSDGTPPAPVSPSNARRIVLSTVRFDIRDAIEAVNGLMRRPVRGACEVGSAHPRRTCKRERERKKNLWFTARFKRANERLRTLSLAPSNG